MANTKKDCSDSGSFAGKLLRFAGKVLAVLLVTVLMVGIAAYGVMAVLTKGPSPSAGRTFALSVQETSAIKFLANWFYTEEELAAMKATTEREYVPTDTTLITIQSMDPEDTESETGADAWGLIDEDGDGIIIEPVRGEGYTGFMMVVLDPSRLVLGSDPGSYYHRGYTVAQFAEKMGGIAAINAGGFVDPDGKGNGSIPESLVVFDGECYFAGSGCRNGFVGIDSNYILHVASRISAAEVAEADIRYGVCFGPVLVSNGEGADRDTLSSGLNPRTAIGQRSDGAILMLVIDGRQAVSLGATYADEVDIMLRYGAVNACNMDGGSSSLLWYDGEYVNNCASVIGIRNIPTSWVVLKEG